MIDAQFSAAAFSVPACSVDRSRQHHPLSNRLVPRPLKRVSQVLVGLALLATLGFAIETGLRADDSETLPSIDQRFAAQVEAAALNNEGALGDGNEVPDFQKHIIPLLGRLGCNGRACHGSFQGQGGFQLSLFGYDFAADHQAMLNPESPRINREQPLQSLIFTKPSSDTEHEGGQRFMPGSWQARVLERWLMQGAPKSESIAKLERLEVEPNELQFTEAGQQVALRVVAIWQDGSREEVTPLCRFQTNDDQIALIDENGVVTSQESGDTHVVVFYDKAVVPIPVLQPVSSMVGEVYPKVETPTRVDELVVEKLRKMGIVPSEVADDVTFLRRVCLDMTGTLPTPTEIQEFVADTDPNKRAHKIDELLESPAYAAWWTTLLCDITGNNSDQLNNTLPMREQATKDWYEWIYQRVANNTPYDQLVDGIVTARSLQPDQSFKEYSEQMCEIYRGEGEAGYASLPSMTHYWTRREFRDREERAIHFAYAFMGIRIQCAQCHKHPFDQWSKADFDEFSKFFDSVVFDTTGRAFAPQEYDELMEALSVGEQRGNALRQQLGRLLTDGKTIPFPVVGIRPPRQPNARQGNNGQGNNGQGNGRDRDRQAASRNRTYDLLGYSQFELPATDDPREPLMQWLREENNPYFARAFVNRVWNVYFGRGIVHPADDLSLANPPSNQALLDHLAAGFVASGFDMKWVHREIANSRTYQSDWRTNETNARDSRNFSHALPRRLPAEVVVDALRQATATDSLNQAYRQERSGHATSLAGTRFVGRDANLGYALQVFGRSTRETTCDCDRTDEPSLLQTVFLYNDRDIHALINRADGWVASQTLTEAQRRQAAQQQSRAQANNQPQGNGNQSPQALRNQVQQLRRRLETAQSAGDQAQVDRLTQRIEQLQTRLEQMRTDESADRSDDNPSRGRENSASSDAQPSPNQLAVDATRLDAWIERAYLRTLSRWPTEQEVANCRDYFRSAESANDGLEGIMWVLINTKEFLVNH